MEFEKLVNTISPKLKAITHKLNGKYTFFNEDDLYQEALFDLWNRNKEGVLSDKTDSYILQSCYFFLKNHIRKIYKKIDRNTISLCSFVNDENEDFQDIFLKESANEINFSEINLLLEKIYGLLNNREKEILSLSLDDLGPREIGRRLGISHVMVIKVKQKIKEKCLKFKEEF